MSISDSAAGSPQSVTLTGTGTSALVTVSPSSLSFGNQAVSIASYAQAITVTNSGNAALTVTSIAILGTNPTDFAQINNCGRLARSELKLHDQRDVHAECKRQPLGLSCDCR